MDEIVPYPALDGYPEMLYMPAYEGVGMSVTVSESESEIAIPGLYLLCALEYDSAEFALSEHPKVKLLNELHGGLPLEAYVAILTFDQAKAAAKRDPKKMGVCAVTKTGKHQFYYI